MKSAGILALILIVAGIITFLYGGVQLRYWMGEGGGAGEEEQFPSEPETPPSDSNDGIMPEWPPEQQNGETEQTQERQAFGLDLSIIGLILVCIGAIIFTFGGKR